MATADLTAVTYRAVGSYLLLRQFETCAAQEEQALRGGSVAKVVPQLLSEGSAERADVKL